MRKAGTAGYGFTDTHQFFEATTVDEALHETCLFTDEGEWFHTRFYHRTSADLLEAISSQKMQGNGLLKISPISYPIFKCDAYPPCEGNYRYAYHQLSWGKDGSLKGYRYPSFGNKLRPGFYSIQKRQYEIRLSDPDYSGNFLRAQIVPELMLLIQPQHLSCFLSNFIVRSRRPDDSCKMRGNDHSTRFFEPQCSSLFINIEPENVCLSSELNTKLHEFPWFSLKPEPPANTRKFPKIFLDSDMFAVAS